MAPRRRTSGIVTNAEGFEIPQPGARSKKVADRGTFILMGVLQIFAVAIIVRQLKHLGVLPAWVNTDLNTFARYLPDNPWIVAPCGHLPTRHVLVISENIVFPEGPAPGALLIKRTRLQKTLRQDPRNLLEIPRLAETVTNLGGHVLDVGSAVVSPGVVDVHVHLNEPGRPHWEGITAGTHAAAAGGVTTVVDMPINCRPAITSVAAMRYKLRAMRKKTAVDMAQWAGLVPQNARAHGELAGMLDLGAVGLKAFMSPSGMPDFANVSRVHIEAALPVLLKHRKPLMVHAEVVSAVDATCDAGCSERSHATWERTRPPRFEVDAAGQIVEALRNVRTLTPAHEWANATAEGSAFGVHIAHLSSAEALPVYQAAQADGLPITVEACAHHLLFAADDVADGATHFKCAPPLRNAENRAALRAAVGSSAIVVASSDHSPSTPRLKNLTSGDFLAAWGGISGLQYLLPAVNTVAREEGWTLHRMAQLLSESPARVAGLAHRKGAIREGLDADLVIWHPYAPANTSDAYNRHRHKLTPYQDLELMGRVQATFVRGAMVCSEEAGVYQKRICGSVLSN